MRVYKRRTNKEAIPENVIKTAISLVLKNRDKKGFSLRSVARSQKMSYTTLGRYVKNYQQAASASDEIDSDEGVDDINIEWTKIPGKVISRDHEIALIEYVHRFSQINCALRPKHTRDMAYQYAIKHNINHPASWDKNKKAGEDWLRSFLRRNKDRLPFIPEVIRSRLATVNKLEVAKFYDNLKELSEKHDLKENSIYCLGDTEVVTVVVPRKTVSQKVAKQKAASAASPEKAGETVTIITAANAAGKVVPPMLIFPQKKCNLNFIKDQLRFNCIVAANETGLITNEDLVTFVKHFIKLAKPSEKNPLLLILDSINACYLSIMLVDLCDKENVKLLVVPPHCALKLHPLKAALTGPFQKSCNRSITEWKRTNPGEKMTIYDLSEIIREPFLKLMTPLKIWSGFARTGIWPIRPENFDVDDVVAQHCLAGFDLFEGIMEEQPDFLAEPAANQEQVDFLAEPAVKQGQVDFSAEPAVNEEQVDFSAEPAVKQEQVDSSAEPAVKQELVDVSAEPAVKQEQVDFSAEPAVKQEQLDFFAEPEIKQEPFHFVEVPEVQHEHFFAEADVKQEQLDSEEQLDSVEQNSPTSTTTDNLDFRYF